MTITLNKKESEEFFYNALCNGLGYVCQYGLQLDYDSAKYKEAKMNWLKKNPGQEACLEDVLMQVLKDGGSLTLVDVEGGDDERHTIYLRDVHEKVSKTDSRRLVDMQTGNDDADTADCILQTVFFNEVIFG